jgi:hypothetical protein
VPPIDFTRRTALYRLYDGADELLYVGIAFDPEARWDYHAGSAAWWPLVERKAVEWHDTRTLALEFEARAIAAERPLYNVRGSQVPRQRVDGTPPSKRTPSRFFRLSDQDWEDFGRACAARGMTRSEVIRANMNEAIAAWKREQRQIAREAAAPRV